MKKGVFLFLVFSLLLVTACQKEPLVGGDEDEHGCIGSAGYTWCESSQKCFRVWEESCNNSIVDINEADIDKILAIELSIQHVQMLPNFDSNKTLEVIEVNPSECIGCWDIKIKHSLIGTNDSFESDVTLSDWKITKIFTNRIVGKS